MPHLLAIADPPPDASRSGPSAAALDTRPRYEFRVFGPDLAMARAALAAVGRPAGEEERRDTYILGRGRIEASLKLRDARLDLKLWSRVVGPFELWCPADRADLPLEGAALDRRFLVPAGLTSPLDPAASYDAAGLLAALEAMPDVRIVETQKHRLRFAFGEALGEWTEVRGDAGRIETVALESPDPAGLQALVDRLDLGDAANTSYPRHQHRVAFGTWA